LGPQSGTCPTVGSFMEHGHAQRVHTSQAEVYRWNSDLCRIHPVRCSNCCHPPADGRSFSFPAHAQTSLGGV